MATNQKVINERYYETVLNSRGPREHFYFKVWMISNTWNSAHVWDNWSTRRAPKRCWHLWNWKGRRRSHSTWTNSVSYFDMKLHHIFSSAIRVGVLHEPKLVYVCAACFSNRTSCRPLGKSSATEREKRLCPCTAPVLVHYKFPLRLVVASYIK